MNLCRTQIFPDFQGNNQNDCWIFALAILLSSTFVYNSMGSFNQQVINQLQYSFCSSEHSNIRGGLESLVLTYANAINSGDLPCMKNRVLALALTENTAAMQKVN
ncbi:Guanylate-binding protein 1 [Sciurus carolinensis]|uniref:Guanylate-binding protein 1 n=1 Tax=Sciurus carolinensis TaxID=30640 RepID=A0AA41NJN4_SCICA|nr:Guanylate-binding protein 1 [Sciurus carolinensis]